MSLRRFVAIIASSGGDRHDRYHVLARPRLQSVRQSSSLKGFALETSTRDGVVFPTSDHMHSIARL